MPRTYTVLTIKTLFGEASSCAYPDCVEPLIFRDRGVTTVVAEIAHIRSELKDGPRYDSTYTRNINGPENLLLLCGKHHRPVDRHSSIYMIEELEEWKATQIASAGSGTPISDAEVRAFANLSEVEQRAIMDIARASSRVTLACRSAQGAMDEVRAANEKARVSSSWKTGPVYATHEDGTQELLNDRMQLPHVEQVKWDAMVQAAREHEAAAVRLAIDDLSGEAAVVRMIDPPIGPYALMVVHFAERARDAVGDAEAVELAIGILDHAVVLLWRVAQGEAEIGST